MKADVKEKWLEGLESDRYRQAKFNLRVGKGMCCLGVLCDVMGQPWGRAMYKGMVSDENYIESEELLKGLKNFNGEYVTLPDELMDEYALTNDQVMELQRLNDGADDYEPTIKYIKENL